MILISCFDDLIMMLVIACLLAYKRHTVEDECRSGFDRRCKYVDRFQSTSDGTFLQTERTRRVLEKSLLLANVLQQCRIFTSCLWDGGPSDSWTVARIHF